MGTEDTQERLARIEALMSGMQAEMAAMRDALIRLVRIEEKLAERVKQEDQFVQRLARAEETVAQMRAFLSEAREFPARVVRIEEQHAGTRNDLASQQEAISQMHERLDQYDERLDGIEQAMASIRGPLLWLAGIAASVVAGLVSLLLGRAL
jgi:DNA repair exonuclease SbcCD ATPase subunit